MSQDVPAIETEIRGLTSQEAAQRVAEGRVNTPPKSAGRSVWQVLARNLFTWFNGLNALLALALILVGSWRNLLFMGVVVSNTFISTLQELRARHTVEKLSVLVAAPVPTLRDGAWVQLHSEELVEDDVVRFAAGDQVCADAHVLEGQGAANESLLTGESDPVPKEPGAELFSGSYVTEGRLVAKLHKVGADSYAGQLVQGVRKIKVSRSQLMEDLQQLIRVISYFLLPIGLLLFAKQYFLLKDPLAQAVPSTVAAMLGMIPEGLMLLTSMALMVGVVRLGAQGTLVQELYGIENLARVDTLCVDKTGTITKGQLRVEEVLPLEGTSEAEVTELMRQLLQASQDDNATFHALRAHFDVPLEEVPSRAALRIPFSSARKWSAVGHADSGSLVIGAPEFVLGERMGPELSALVEEKAASGLRVLLLASTPQLSYKEQLPPALAPMAVFLLNDELREDFAPTAAYLEQEGVRVEVISGDNPRTVAEVARRAGLPGAERWVDANTLRTDPALNQAAEDYDVFGRVAPDQKRKLVLALKEKGHTVAMMGDGVNDVPALKVCDCAIAMAGGSDAARRVSQLTLLHENFSALPHVVLEGRRVINNITRSASLFLVKTLFSFLLGLVLLVLPWSYPFKPIQMTLVSTFTVGIPSFLLALEPNKERVKDGFLQTILRNALPGALTNTILIVVAHLLMGPIGLTEDQLSTVCVGIIAVTGLLVLTRTCWPLNRLRLALVVTMTGCLLVGALLFGGFFLLTPLPAGGWWLLLALAMASPVCIYLLDGLVNRVQQRMQPKT